MRRLFPLAALVLLAACGDLPQPFRHDDNDVPKLARPKMDRGLTIRPIEGAPQGEALAAAMAAALERHEILAVVRSGPAFGNLLEAQLAEEGGRAVINWRLSAPDGTILSRHVQAVPATAWGQADKNRLKLMATEAAAVLAPPLLVDPDALAKTQDLAKPDPADRRPVVMLANLAGLPGDGDKTLMAALRAALGQNGVLVRDGGAEHLVQGSVTVTPGRPNEDNVLVVWQVKNAKDGATLASIDQGGAVPRGRLDLPWGSLARDIAEGGAAGLVQALKQLQRKPPPGASASDPTMFTEQGPADIGGADPSEQKTQALDAAASAPAPAPAKAAPVKKTKAKAVGPGSAKGKVSKTNQSSPRVKRAQR